MNKKVKFKEVPMHPGYVYCHVKMNEDVSLYEYTVLIIYTIIYIFVILF